MNIFILNQWQPVSLTMTKILNGYLFQKKWYVIFCKDSQNVTDEGHHFLHWPVTEMIFHLSEKWKILTKDAQDNFDNTGKNLLPILKNEVRSQKSSWRCTAP